MLSKEFLAEVAPPKENYTKLYAIAWQLGKMPALPMIKSSIPDFMVDTVSRDLGRIVKAKKAYPANPQKAIDAFFDCGPDSGKQVDLKKMFGTDYNAVKKLHDAHWQAIWDKNNAERAAKAKPQVNGPGPKIPAGVFNHLEKIKTECSDILKLYKANPGHFFYRGISIAKSILKGQSQSRESLHTPDDIHQEMSAAMKMVGLTAVRNNSIFVTAEFSEAAQYADGSYGDGGEGEEGAVYIFLPVNGFAFSWSPKVFDFYADWEGGEINFPEDGDWTDLIKELKYTNKQLPKALKSICEVMFTGKYYMINADYKAALANLLK